MSGISAVIAAISSDVVAKMAAAGLPPLADKDANGNPTIAIGRVSVDLNSYIPRIIFIPASFTFAAPSPGHNASPVQLTSPSAPGSGIRVVVMTAYGGGGYDNTTTVTFSTPDVAGGTRATGVPLLNGNGGVKGIQLTEAGSGYLRPPTVTISGPPGASGAAAACYLRPTPQALTVATRRAIWTEKTKFQVEVWGATSTSGAVTPDQTLGAVLDYDATQQMVHQVIATCQTIAAGVFVPNSGKWVDAETASTHTNVVGHYATFAIEIAGPVLAEPMVPTAGASVQPAPVGVQQNPTLVLQPFPGGTPEQGVP